MNDQELFDHFSYACLVWGRANGAPDISVADYDLYSPGGLTINITRWDSEAPQPTNTQLKTLTVEDCEAEKAMEQLRTFTTRDYRLAEATDAQIVLLGEVPDGAMLMNTDLGLPQVRTGGAWVTLSPAEPPAGGAAASKRSLPARSAGGALPAAARRAVAQAAREPAQEADASEADGVMIYPTGDAAQEAAPRQPAVAARR
jgi:hypothetical protein